MRSYRLTRPRLRGRKCLSWVAAVVFCLVPVKLAGAQSAADLQVGVPDLAQFPTVRMFVQLTGAEGHPVAGVQKRHVQLWHNEHAVIDFQWRGVFDDLSWLAVALVVDRSGSMEGRALRESKAAAISFIEGLGRRDRVAAITFGDDADITADFGAERSQVRRQIQRLSASGETALIDAVLLAAEALDAVGATRRALVVLTDGRDTASEVDWTEAIRQIQETRWPCFVIGLGSEVDEQPLQQLAVTSGGRYFRAPTPRDIGAIYRTLARDLSRRYLLSYDIPPSEREVDLHRLRVTVQREGSVHEAHQLFGRGVAQQRSAAVGKKAEPSREDAESGWGPRGTIRLFMGALGLLLGVGSGYGIVRTLGVAWQDAPSRLGVLIMLCGILGGLAGAYLGGVIGGA